MDETEKEQSKTEAPPTGDVKKMGPPAESKLNRFLVRTLRWVLGFLVIAGLGALLVIFTLYMPLRQKWQESQAAVQQSNQQVADLEGQIEDLNPLEAQNKDLQARLEQSELHVAILSSRADIAAAQLALAQDDVAKARLALSKTGDTLKTLEVMLRPGEKKLATDMQARLELAFKGIADNAFAAASDLNVLSNSLVELENAYFAKP
jgi:TolA-binding protein